MHLNTFERITKLEKKQCPNSNDFHINHHLKPEMTLINATKQGQTDMLTIPITTSSWEVRNTKEIHIHIIGHPTKGCHNISDSTSGFTYYLHN